MKTKDIVNWILLIAGAIVLGLILVPYQKSKNAVYIPIPDSCIREVDSIMVVEESYMVFSNSSISLQQVRDSLQDEKIRVLAETVQYLFEEKNRIDIFNKLVLEQFNILNGLLIDRND